MKVQQTSTKCTGSGSRRMLQASVTVEAAFIVPVVTMVIFGIIMLGYFLHNRIRLASVVDASAGYAAVNGLPPEEAKEHLDECLTGFFAADTVRTEVEADGTKLVFSVMIRSRIVPDGLTAFFAGRLETITYTTTVEQNNRTEIMRRLRCGEDILKLLERCSR